MATTETIVSRIQKLIALASNNPSEIEAASAMEAAQELLSKYNLSMAQVDAQAKKEGVQPTAAPRSKEKVERSAMFKFQRRIWEALAETNFCVYWSQAVHDPVSGVYKTHHHFLLGRVDNVTTVKLMGAYLEDIINRLCPYKSGKSVHQWKEGCADRICARLQEKRRRLEDESRQVAKAQESTNPGTAIVLASVFQSEQHLNYVFQYGNDKWCSCPQCRERRNLEWRAAQERISKENAGNPLVLRDETIPSRPETAAERRRRENRWRRDQARWRREDAQEHARTSSDAYRQGVATGDKVGIDSQVKGSDSRVDTHAITDQKG